MTDSISLPAVPDDAGMDVTTALSARRSIRRFSDAPLPLDRIATALWAAQGETGDRGERTAPSAHAAYPLRVYLASRRVIGLEAGVYTYHPATHELALVHLQKGVGARLQNAALDEQPWLSSAPAVIVLAGDAALMTAHFMEQPPVGQRGERYLYLEAGAAAENVSLTAAALGLGTVLVGGFDDDAAHRALGFDDDARVVALMPLGYPPFT